MSDDLVDLVPAAPASEPILTKTQLVAACPEIKAYYIEQIYPHILNVLEKYGIETPLRIAMFLATCGHESASFTLFSENLNYSQQALRAVFKKYFPNDAIAAQYARKPQAIGNRVYANRMGNGPETSGDGYIFRGAGAIQLTGRKNIGMFALAMGMPIDQAVSYLRTLPGGLEGAGWFWNVNNLNAYADAGRFQALQGLVNAGRADATVAQINGWNDRANRYLRAKKALGIA